MVKFRRNSAAQKSQMTMTYFKQDCNVHNNSAYFKFAKHLLQKKNNINLFNKPVCFASRLDQRKWRKIGDVNRGVSLAESCACISTFHRRSQDHLAIGANPPVLLHQHVAVLEGVTYPQRFRGIKSVHFYEFHSCVVIVDNFAQTIHVWNHWKLGVRPQQVERIWEIQPRLVLRLVSMYKTFKVYYSGGDQVHGADCRYKALCFLKKLGEVQDFKTELQWKKLY